MIPLYFETKPNGVPLLSNRDIEQNAVAILKDFSPNLLKEPGPVDIERFLESYLGLNLDFNWLSNNQSILGRTLFFDTMIPVFDPATQQAEDFPVEANTIVIDNSLVDIEVLLRSTMAHECGHAIYHSAYYQQKAPMESAACTTTDINFQNKSNRLTTDHDWLEHHARYFSAALLMPYPTVRIVRKEYTEHLDTWYKNEPTLHNHLMAHQVASVFKVSVAAAKIRLRQLRLDIPVQRKPSTAVFPHDHNTMTLASMTDLDLARIVEARDDRLFEQYYG